MIQTFLMFVVCTIVFVTVSFLTPPPSPEQTENLCWKNPIAVITQEKFTGWTDPRVWALLLLVVIAALYVTFA